MTKKKRSHHKKPNAEVPVELAPLTEAQRILAQLRVLKAGLTGISEAMERMEKE